MLEEWRPVKNYEGLYEVSCLGNIRSLDRPVHHWRGGKSFIIGKILKRNLDQNGYAIVHLSKNNQAKLCKIHLLVWDVFGNKPRDGIKIQVDHIDNDKNNCQIDNLQLLNSRQNCSKDQKSKCGNPTGVQLLSNGRFKARAVINGIETHLGTFASANEASFKYQQTINNLNEVSI
jgi:hypothetical protein